MARRADRSKKVIDLRLRNPLTVRIIHRESKERGNITNIATVQAILHEWDRGISRVERDQKPVAGASGRGHCAENSGCSESIVSPGSGSRRTEGGGNGGAASRRDRRRPEGARGPETVVSPQLNGHAPAATGPGGGGAESGSIRSSV